MAEFGHMKQTRAWPVNPGSIPGAPIGDSETLATPSYSKSLAAIRQ